MNTSKLAAIVLIVAGILGLAYGGFSYTKATHRADLGPLHMSLNEKQYVNTRRCAFPEQRGSEPICAHVRSGSSPRAVD
jgi:hypothetical protein